MLPNRFAFQFAKLEPYGFFIVMFLVISKVLYVWMTPVMTLASGILHVLVSPLTIFMN